MSAIVAASVCMALMASNLGSLALAAHRLRLRYRLPPPRSSIEGVSVVVPMRGIETFGSETLKAAFSLDYPKYELIFCVAQADDPVVPLIRRFMADFPRVPSRLLIGDDRVSDNPKLNNCVKGWQAARHDWVVLADSNVLMPRDYIQQLRASWRPDTGLVCSTPIGSRPDGFAAVLECAFLNTLQARWQYTGESLGLGFAQGKSMLWHRPFLEARGGIRALAAEIAEDAAATKLVRRAGRKVHLVHSPFEQPLGARKAPAVWSRQIRWARLRRVTFPWLFLPEVLTSALIPALFGAYAAAAEGYGALATLAVLATLLALSYAAETALAYAKGWHVSWQLPGAMLLRDALIPAMWVGGWIGAEVVWHGQSITVQSKRDSLEESPSAA